MSTAHRRPKQPELLRQQLLQAASELAIQRGAPAVTLEAVARLAGVSKGGLLHHFPSKQALFDALYDSLQGQFDSEVSAAQAADPEPRGRAARAYLRVSAQGWGAAQDQQRWQALIAAMLADPALRSRWRAWDDAACAPDQAPGEDPSLLLLCRLAADGLWLSDLLGSRSVSPEQRQAVIARLDALSRQGAPALTPSSEPETRP
jgi:AcrR family transcriptional regulator